MSVCCGLKLTVSVREKTPKLWGFEPHIRTVIHHKKIKVWILKIAVCHMKVIFWLYCVNIHFQCNRLTQFYITQVLIINNVLFQLRIPDQIFFYFARFYKESARKLVFFGTFQPKIRRCFIAIYHYIEKRVKTSILLPFSQLFTPFALVFTLFQLCLVYTLFCTCFVAFPKKGWAHFRSSYQTKVDKIWAFLDQVRNCFFESLGKW